MKPLLLTIGIFSSCLGVTHCNADTYTTETTKKDGQQSASKPNILLICVDDLRTELPSFGKEYIHAPEMEKLFSKSRLFKRHYVQAPTCGASRFALLTGIYPTTKEQLKNTALTQHDHTAQPSFPAWFQSHGYTTVSVGKVSHYPGGLSGKKWADKNKPEIPNAWSYHVDPSGEWKNAQALMHGYDRGKPRKHKKSPLVEAIPDVRYPDDAIMDAFNVEFDKLAKQDKPWLLAVGLLRPHLPFACEQEFLDLYKDKTIPNYSSPKPAANEMWHKSGEFFGQYAMPSDPRKNNAFADVVRKHYAACISSSDRHIGNILKKLKDAGLDENTVIVLWGDHGWHLGEQQIWGKHVLYEVALHSPLSIKTPAMKQPGTATDNVVETVDIYPTLCALADLPTPAHLQGKDLKLLLNDPKADSKNLAISYWDGKRSEITPNTHKIIDLKSGKVTQEYNLIKDWKELNNLKSSN